MPPQSTIEPETTANLASLNPFKIWKMRSFGPDQKYSLAFVGHAEELQQAVIELTYNYGVASYELGTAYDHIAIGVEDVYAVYERVKTAGAQVSREPGPVKGGTTVIAFVQDPDGYKIELIERAWLIDVTLYPP